jgi:hypothetical protein
LTRLKLENMKTLLHQVSVYEGYDFKGPLAEEKNTIPIGTVDIFDWLKKKPSQALFEKLKMIRNGDLSLKGKIECITPHGVFHPKRAKGNHISHSGLIFVDIDVKGDHNSHINDIGALFTMMCSIPQVVYCSRSASGTGIHLLIPIAYPEKHVEHYSFVTRWFAGMKITIDQKPKHLAAVKGYTWDPNAYFNPGASILENFDDLRPVPPAPKKDYKPHNGVADANEPIWEWFNRTADVPAMLESYGYRYLHTTGENMHFSRPGQPVKGRTGVTWHAGKGVIYYFTDGTPASDGGEARKPFTVFATYQFNGDKRAAAKFLIEQVKMRTAPPRAPRVEPTPIPPPPAAPSPKTAAILETAAITPIAAIAPEATPAPAATAVPHPARFADQPTQRPKEDWGEQIQALKSFFNSHPIPAGPIQLSQAEIIRYPARFIAGHLSTIQARNGNETFKPYLSRLQNLQDKMKDETKLLPGAKRPTEKGGLLYANRIRQIEVCSA